MIALLKFECHKQKFAVLGLTIGTAFLILVSMLFYPTLQENIGLVAPFLSSGMMSDILSMFNIELSAFTSLLGFYAAYVGMWVALIGAIGFIYYASSQLSDEFSKGSIAYLLSKPVSRGKVLFAKWLVITLNVIVYMLVITFVSFLSLNAMSPYAPLTINEALLESSDFHFDKDQSQAYYDLIAPDEALFSDFTTTLLMNQFKDNQAELEASDIDINRIMSVIGQDIENPEVVFDEMLASPENYMNLFGMDNMTTEAFTQAVTQEANQYRQMKDGFLNHPEAFSTYMDMLPSYFLSVMIKTHKIDAFNQMTDFEMLEKGFLSTYDLSDFLSIQIRLMMIVWFAASLGLSLVALMPHYEKMGLLGILTMVVMYFINSMKTMLPIKVLGYFSIYQYFPISVQNEINFKGLIPLIVFAMIGAIIGYKRFSKVEI